MPVDVSELLQRLRARLAGHPWTARLTGHLWTARLAGHSWTARLAEHPWTVRLTGHPWAARLPGAFRLPTENDPVPDSHHLAAICAWAAALGLGGMAVALRAFVGLIGTDSWWYAPSVIFLGLVGLGATIGAFASVHRRRLPFTLLGAATVVLAAGWLVTGL